MQKERVKCEHCGRDFKYQSTLDKHIRIYCKARMKRYAEEVTKDKVTLKCSCGKIMLDGGSVGMYCPLGLKCPSIESKNIITRSTNSMTNSNGKICLVKAGKHYLNPLDVSNIKEAKKGLYIIKLKSEPNPEWPIWVEEKDLASLLTHFNIEE